MANMGVTTETRYRSSLGRFMSEVELGVGQTLMNLSVDLADAAKAYSRRHNVTGKMAGSIVGRVQRGAAVAIVNYDGQAPYWEYVHDGSPRHDIPVPPGKRALTQRGGNAKTPNDPSFFSREDVDHPGTRRPNPFMRKAYDKVWPTAIIQLDENID